MRITFLKMDKCISNLRNNLTTKNRAELLKEPKTDIFYQNSNENRLAYCVASMQGWRNTMEDFYSVKVGLNATLSDWSYFGVFDGHYGNKVAKFCSENLLDTLLTNGLEGDVKEAVLKGFYDMDQQLQGIAEVMVEQSGSTVILVLISPEKIYIANLGDSRAVFYSESYGICVTKDHKPFMPDEKYRIEQAGAFVKKGRINGKISVSRTLGDFSFKSHSTLKPNEQQISSEPEILTFDRAKDDKFLILASDGIWRGFKTTEICQFVEERLLTNMDLKDICREIINHSLLKGSFDNMCIILIVF